MEEVTKNNARCPNCGKDLFIATGVSKVTCSNCGEEISALMAIKYYESLNENREETKEAHGEDYHKLSLILDEIYGLIELEDYEGAENKYMEALDLADTDYRVYMAMVAIKTRNYTDLKDEEHKFFINKAIACADGEQKKEIVKTYRNYYRKANLSEEDLLSYSSEENRIRKTKLENGLKSMIPEYMAKEKQNKIFLIIYPICITLGIAVVIATMFIESLKWASLVGAGVTVVGYLFFRTWFLNRDKIKAFNSLLDLYDFIDSTSFSEDALAKIYFHMQKHCDKFLDNSPTASLAHDTARFIDYAIELNDEKLNNFLLKDKYFSQFVDVDERGE